MSAARVRFTFPRSTFAWPALALVGLAGCSAGQTEEATAISTAQVVRMDLDLIAEASGSLGPIRSVQVMSKASGEVVDVLVDTGDRVEAGALMAEIDPRDVQSAYNQALADFEVAEQRLAISEAQLRRSEELLRAGVITDQDHEGRNLDRANQLASFERSRTALELARVRMEDVTIRAPLAGTVLTRTVEEGTVISSPSGNVSGGTVLFTVADLTTMQVRSLVNEADVGRLQAGMTATIAVDAFPERTFTGQVEKIEAQAAVSQNVVNFPVIVTLDNSDGLLKPGMSANVTIQLAERANALALPNHAIVTFAEMIVAAEVLGVPDERLLADQSGFQELRQQLAQAGRAGGAGGATAVAPDSAAGATAAPGAPPAGGQANAAGATAGGQGQTLEEIRAQAQAAAARGDQAQMQALAQQLGGGAAGFARGGGGGGRGGNRGGGGGGRGGGGGTTNRATQPDDARPGVVFVQGEDGLFSARAVLIGVTDWTNSEIMAGVQEGETVALLGGVPQQASQQNPMGRGGMQFRF